jgi:hypothetical protein
MGYDLLSSSNDDFRWTQTFWPRVLALAEKFGWDPLGTTVPKDYTDSDWDGNYSYNEGQIVEAEDAASLADALEKAIPILPQETIQLPQTDLDQIPPENFFSGPDGRQSIEEFIDFCRKGSFEIN